LPTCGIDNARSKSAGPPGTAKYNLIEIRYLDESASFHEFLSQRSGLAAGFLVLFLPQGPALLDNKGTRASEIMQTTAATWTRGALLCFCALTLTGCLRPFSKSVFDPPTAQFPGITSQWQGGTGSDIRVIFVHGICTHDATWITADWDVVMKRYFPSETMTAGAASSVGQVQIIDHEYQIGANKISGRYLIWSALTATDKAKLNYDNRPTDSPSGEFSWKRAKINGSLKASLLNDCLSDAVIYAGYRGTTDIQVAMQNAVCVALDGTTTNDTCTFPPTYGHGNRRIVIVTESLGSRMVFDAISALTIEAKNKSAAAVDAFYEAVAPITQIYMLANQLPILALARPALVPKTTTTDPTKSKTPAMATALSVLSDARARHEKRREIEPQLAATESKLGLVAFTDPNDLLSYRLLTNDPAVVGANTSVVNVITSNDYSYLGLVENPLTAHEGYNLNKNALRLLFGGSRKERPHQ
jgi:hypothetical protein